MMKLRSRTTIAAPPELVWPWLTEPALMSEWNPKLVFTDRQPSRRLMPGESYRLVYRMSGDDQEVLTTIVSCQEPVEVTLEHLLVAAPGRRVVRESYICRFDGRHTRVEQSIDLGRAGVPFLVRPLIWFLHRFGKPAEKPYLEKLRELVEAAATARTG